MQEPTPTTILFFIYCLDIAWLFGAFTYAFTLLISLPFGIVINPRLNWQQSVICLVVIASWTKYIATDFSRCAEWILDPMVTQGDIVDQIWHELQSLITSILTTLLITGYKFGGK